MSSFGDENLNQLQSNRSSFNNSNPREVQRLLEKIYSLKVDLNLTDRCILKAIEFAREFLTKYFDGKFHAELICQTALFLACKCEGSFCTSENISKRTGKVFYTLPDETQPDIHTFKNNLFDCEDCMICKLGFGKLSWNLSKCIQEVVNKIPDDTLTRGRKYELARIAGVLVEGSIAMKPICVGYTFDLIACLCVQLAIEVQKYQFPPDIWVKDASTFRLIQSLMDRYSNIFSQCPSLFEKTFGNEHSLYIKVNQITSKRVERMNELSLCRPLYLEQHSPDAELTNYMIESNAMIAPSALSTEPTPRNQREQTSDTNEERQLMDIDNNGAK